ncbi:MAG: hypothetical protein HZC01_03830 [Candidatus Kerfeldbacteria bacterium]|nr:hypothetical protein [Candidatus Kerfeldbacteria bacterium]
MHDFFKPTKAKIILALLIPLYIGYVVEVTSVTVSGATFDLTRESWHITALPYAALIFGALGVIVGRENYFSELQNYSFMQGVWYFILEAVLPLLITYLLSCGIMYVYRRFFPSKKPVPIPNQKDLEL